MQKKPSRETVPKATREAVLREFRYRCAICASERPQLHHIDEDRANSDPWNLLPLCPNCHLLDQHDPTAPIDRDKLRLFRRYRDPMILHERFHPVWSRCRFLLDIGERSRENLKTAAEELFQFVGALKMGDFYANRLRDLFGPPPRPHVWSVDTPPETFDQWAREETTEYREILSKNREAGLGSLLRC